MKTLRPGATFAGEHEGRPVEGMCVVGWVRRIEHGHLGAPQRLGAANRRVPHQCLEDPGDQRDGRLRGHRPVRDEKRAGTGVEMALARPERPPASGVPSGAAVLHADSTTRSAFSLKVADRKSVV